MSNVDSSEEDVFELQKALNQIRVLLEISTDLFRGNITGDSKLSDPSETARFLQDKAYAIAVDHGIQDVFKTPVDIQLVNTCRAVPEQYDVFMDNQKIGYLRLRHGRFSAKYPSHFGEEVYSNEEVRGIGFFHNQEERVNEIRKALVAILKALGCFYPDPQFEAPVFEDDELDFSDSAEMLSTFQKEVEKQ